MTTKKITLVCTPLKFHRGNDENMFFEWLDKIKCIKAVKGVGRELHLFIDSNIISDEELLDLMGLFTRYKFDLAQLNVFKNESNKHWFED